jgi:hypothetical protein
MTMKNEPKTLTFDELINRISASLEGFSGKELEEMANKILPYSVKYVEDSYFEVK